MGDVTHVQDFRGDQPHRDPCPGTSRLSHEADEALRANRPPPTVLIACRRQDCRQSHCAQTHQHDRTLDHEIEPSDDVPDPLAQERPTDPKATLRHIVVNHADDGGHFADAPRIAKLERGETSWRHSRRVLSISARSLASRSSPIFGAGEITIAVPLGAEVVRKTPRDRMPRSAVIVTSSASGCFLRFTSRETSRETHPGSDRGGPIASAPRRHSSAS